LPYTTFKQHCPVTSFAVGLHRSPNDRLLHMGI